MGNLHRKRRKARKLGRRTAELAWGALDESRPEEAERLMREALRGHAGDCTLWNDLGIILWRRDKLREAETAFRNALTIRPGYEDAATHLASLLASRGFYRQALRVEEEMVERPGARREFHEKRCAEYRRAIEALAANAEPAAGDDQS